MHIAFDGGCFQQGILGGIYQVACGFLNAAKARHPDLAVTLVCDPRQGLVRDEALAGLSWRPDAVYAPVAISYDPPEEWPAAPDAHVRFYADGRIVPAVIEEGVARYEGAAPKTGFAILSRAGVPAEPQPGKAGVRTGIRIERIEIAGEGAPVRIHGSDRRLAAGFLDDGSGARWTDGAGFVPLAFFAGAGETITVEVAYRAQESYHLAPGPAADHVREARRALRTAERDRLLAILAEDLRARGCTVYFANHFTPIAVPGLINVAWAYDLIPVLLPQYFHADARLNFDENLRIFTAADRVYAISHCTRDDLVANTAVTESQAITAGIATSGGFAPRSPAAVRRVLAPFGLHEKQYILAVATIEPRKNHLRMLLAYMDLRRRLPDCPDLLFVGKMGWDFERLLTTRAENDLEHSVKILSDVPEDDLACLYSGAMFSAYLSVYEGFGLPIVEAMAAGCPVLTSDRSSMAEVAGQAALLVNPYDIDGIAAAMQRLATDRPLRDDLARRGLERARAYDWAVSSEIIMRDLAALAGGGG